MLWYFFCWNAQQNLGTRVIANHSLCSSKGGDDISVLYTHSDAMSFIELTVISK